MRNWHYSAAWLILLGSDRILSGSARCAKYGFRSQAAQTSRPTTSGATACRSSSHGSIWSALVLGGRWAYSPGLQSCGHCGKSSGDIAALIESLKSVSGPSTHSLAHVTRHPSRTKHGVRQAGQPAVVIAHTVKGKGISFVEADYHWHGKALSPEQAEQAREEIRCQ